MASIDPDTAALPVESRPTPAYHRRVRIGPQPQQVTALLEDDFHAMSVTLRHDGARVLAVEPRVVRAPWSTCPGAEAQLVATFSGAALAEVTARRDKPANCTHLHDLAVLAAAHALNARPTSYEIIATDPVDGSRILSLSRDGVPLLHWHEDQRVLTAPAAIAGRTLMTLRDWIATLPPSEQEAARMLQWSGLVAHGRTIPLEQQSDAAALPPSCYTFQPARAAIARRIGESRDFSDGSRVPLEVFHDMQ